MKIFKSKYSLEQDLIKGCLKGHAKSQRALYNKYAPLLYSICLRYLKSVENAEECLTNGFVKIFEHIKNKKEETSLEGWMKKIIVNECLQYIRKQKGQFLYIEDLNTEPWAFEEDCNNEPQEILNAIEQLPIGYRTIFNLYAIEEFKHKEIAEKLNITEGTSKSQYFKAKKMIKHILQTQTDNSKIN